MPVRYNHKKIEKKWQEAWEKQGLYKAQFPSDKKKYYVLIEFPYPSGERLHVGHARSYSAMDALARKRRMQGYNVLYPIGWDAFGLPAENYAIKTGIHPAITTKKNIENAKAQAKSWGLSFDWSRQINTTDPKYYRWTQWIFLQMFKRGLAYRAEIPVNWCPSCKTNLANEEVIKKPKANGENEEINVCERCWSEVTRRMQKQWMLRITAYAERLLEDLEKVDYREDIAKMQQDWIGKKEGAVVQFPISNFQFSISVFTTRLDTLYGATALVIAPDKMVNGKHLALKIAKKSQYHKVKEYIEKSQKISELERTELKEKTGVFTGAYAVNPINGEKIPIWVADYVVGWYGEGAIMLVPASDRRDWEFAKKYGIKVRRVVVKRERGKLGKENGKNQNAGWEGAEEVPDKPFVEDGVLVLSGKYTGLSSRDARDKILEDGKKKGWAKAKTTYKLRDWVFSRQHYWGEPIPIIYCRRCFEMRNGQDRNGYAEIDEEKWAAIPVPEEDLPVKLPHLDKYKPSDTGESPLAKVKDWVETECPKCGGEARRETDTMPNWAGSSWYFLRYVDPDNDKRLAGEKELKYWMPVDWYNGGLEHTTLHLLYSRFWHKFLYDLGMVPTPEPYAERTSHGVVLGPDGAKMSKSRGNVINPDDIVEKFGADTLRVYEMFMGPFEEQVAWSENALKGVRRFLERVWRLYNPKSKLKSQKSKTTAGSSSGSKTDFEDMQELELKRKLHKTVKKVDEDIEELKFNTAIAALMEFVNEVYKKKIEGGRRKVENEDAGIFLRLLAPFAPHLAEELWQKIQSGKGGSIHKQPWPKYDPELVKEEIVEFVVQVDGKVRAALVVGSAKSKVQSEMEKLAMQEENIKRHLEGRRLKKTIFVPGRLLNFVTKS